MAMKRREEINYAYFDDFCYRDFLLCLPLWSRVNSSGSQKAADSNVALRMIISALVRFINLAKISKNVASLVD